MSEETKSFEALIQAYPEEYQALIRESLSLSEKEFETFIISLIM
ncbi:hypothetical protein [Eubacterium sp. 1001713B170207_170306_E7]|nr:hypothetical protein [Eubacterium sp. 1001713B170207_170306_E7]